MYYVTVNNQEEAGNISGDLLEQQLAVCTNWFPIMCAYRWEGEIKQGAEVVLIIKTRENLRDKIEAVIAKHISYTNFIAEIAVHSINAAFEGWLEKEVNGSPPARG